MQEDADYHSFMISFMPVTQFIADVNDFLSSLLVGRYSNLRAYYFIDLLSVVF